MALETYKYEEIIISQAARIASLEEDLRIQEELTDEEKSASKTFSDAYEVLVSRVDELLKENERLTRRCMNLNADATTWCEANGRLIGGLAEIKNWIMGSASVQIGRAELVDEMNKHGLWKDLES